MAIKITVGDAPEVEAEVKEEPKVPQISMKMNARKTLDGSLAIYDHLDIDIVVVPKSNKVLALAKNSMSDEVYDTQSRMFDYLVKKGVVLPETVRGGNVYGSLEGQYPPSSDGRDHGQVAIFTIGKFIEEEKPYYTAKDNLDDTMEDWWLDASEEDTTNLGEIPQAQVKGSIPKGMERMHGYRVYESKE
tara:strand:- start:154 stop:720 length:567 start_codon:yes stop_codon:yes gene_type:complete